MGVSLPAVEETIRLLPEPPTLRVVAAEVLLTTTVSPPVLAALTVRLARPEYRTVGLPERTTAEEVTVQVSVVAAGPLTMAVSPPLPTRVTALCRCSRLTM